MMRKIKFNSFVTKRDIENIIERKYPNKECPDCHTNSVIAGCIEDQFDDKSGEYIILSFTVFCKDCGSVLTKWDNTNREYYFGNR